MGNTIETMIGNSDSTIQGEFTDLDLSGMIEKVKELITKAPSKLDYNL